MINARPVLFFDSGVGGLTVLAKAREKITNRQFIYIADDAGFPYGEREEIPLRRRIIDLFGRLLARFQPAVVVIACNTASTLALSAVRESFPAYPFVGTVPAIKPAAERTKTGLISLLATPATVDRTYTRDLISRYANHCQVNLVGSNKLATIAEMHAKGYATDEDVIHREIAPCFVRRGEVGTDIVVLACTHYPLLLELFTKLAPWPVDWLDPSEAIALQAAAKLNDVAADFGAIKCHDQAYFTSGSVDSATQNLLSRFRLTFNGPC